jgi:hypothetical protein
MKRQLQGSQMGADCTLPFPLLVQQQLFASAMADYDRSQSSTAGRSHAEL